MRVRNVMVAATVMTALAGHLATWDTHAVCAYANTHTSPHGIGGSVVDRYGIGEHPGHELEHVHAHDHEH